MHIESCHITCRGAPINLMDFVFPWGKISLGESQLEISKNISFMVEVLRLGEVTIISQLFSYDKS